MGSDTHRASIPGSSTAVIRRTILGDEDPGELRTQASESFTGARDYADKSEIAQSMLRLKKLYGMDAYPISREGKTVKPGEPVILVGHGGHGQFMSLDPADLEFALHRWGVGEGMHVVLAGCQSAEAAKVIESVVKITGIKPVVNNDLAFTGPKHEFRMDENASSALFGTRNSALKGIDFDYVEQHRALYKAVTDTITEANYLVWLQLITKAATGLNISAKHLAKNPGPKQASTLRDFWADLVTKKISKNTAAAIQQVRTVQQVFTIYAGLTDANATLIRPTTSMVRDGHLKLVNQSNMAAIASHNSFITAMEATLKASVQPVHYLVEVARMGGPIPEILKTLRKLRRVVDASPVGGGDVLYSAIVWHVPEYRELMVAIKPFVKGNFTLSLMPE